MLHLRTIVLSFNPYNFDLFDRGHYTAVGDIRET